MSGGGRIIEKTNTKLAETGKDVVRYLVSTDAGRSWHDETYVYGEPAEAEPAIGDAIWWGGEQVIYWGENDEKRLTKVGYSWTAR